MPYEDELLQLAEGAKVAQTYDSSKIQVLEGLEAVRRRPAMYAGPLDNPALFNLLVQESLCTSMDEVVGSHCTEIQVTVSSDTTVTIRDNGRGLSMKSTLDDIPYAQLLLSKLMACHDNKEKAHLKESCCTIGIVVVNALSAWFRVRNYRDGICWFQEYRCGNPVAPFAQVAETTESGLELSFFPDPTILTNLRFDPQQLTDWIREIGIQIGAVTIKESEGTEAPTVMSFKALKPAENP